MPRKTVVADVKTSSQHVSLPTKLPCQGSKLTNSHDNLPNQTSNPNLWPKIKKKKKTYIVSYYFYMVWDQEKYFIPVANIYSTRLITGTVIFNELILVWEYDNDYFSKYLFLKIY